MIQPQQSFGVVIVGDEILSAKRRDSHLEFIINALAIRGARPGWARFLPDDIEIQAQAYKETQASGLPVFSFGGIGATPDDLTRQAAAQAFDRDLLEHPEGIRLMQARFKSDLNHRRRQLVNFPRGAALIPNPVNQVPGFSLCNHFFVPGFPNMAHPMVEWVLDTHFANVFSRAPDVEYLLQTTGVYESDLIPMIENILVAHPLLKIACLPKNDVPGQVELGVKGQQKAAVTGFDDLVSLLNKAMISYQILNEEPDHSSEKC